jgi:excisionase family DNA binding protein
MTLRYQVRRWYRESTSSADELASILNVAAQNGYELDCLIEMPNDPNVVVVLRQTLSEDPFAWLSVNEMSEKLKVAPTTVIELINTGELPAVKVGRAWKIPVEAAAIWFNQQNSQQADVFTNGYQRNGH